MLNINSYVFDDLGPVTSKMNFDLFCHRFTRKAAENYYRD